MSHNSNIINSLLQGTRKLDPQLADILSLMSSELVRIAHIVDPAPIVSNKISPGLLERPLGVTTFDYFFTGTSIVLFWDAPQDGFLMYEIRTNSSSWSDGNKVVSVSSLSAILDPNDSIGGTGKYGLVGSRFFTIMAINELGQLAIDEDVLEIIVPPLGAITVTPNVINNQVILSWTEPTTTFNIDKYKIYKDGNLLQDNIRGTFFVIQEGVAGEFTYGVEAVDIVGNTSSLATVTLDVNGPADFEIQDVQTSNLSGTIVNGKIEDGRLFVNLDLTTTYEDHFINNTWNSPQEQIDGGYPLWIQPTLATGSYEEIFDFGSIFTNVIVNLSYLFDTIIGSFTFSIDARVSDDNVTYSSAFTTPSFFTASARYVKVKLTFNAASDVDLMAFSNFICTLLVKREIDSGEADVFAADGAGTVISFNKLFRIVESITITPLETGIRQWVYDFDHTTEDPTDFLVLLWNSAGVRVDGTISWKARGII